MSPDPDPEPDPIPDPAPADWSTDTLLGEPFEARALPDEGTLVAFRGAVAAEGPAAGCAVLWVHGWSDYFFHRDLAVKWAGLGARFYALDLRGYGRSLLASGFDGSGRALDGSGETTRPGYIEDLDEYEVEIGAALDLIDAEAPGTRIVLAGHSTGGLVLTLWADRHPGRASALVLHSPWLEFQFTAGARKLLKPLLELGGLGNKQLWRNPIPVDMPNFYTLSVASHAGAVPYDLRLKPTGSFPVYPGWLAAIFDGHERVEDGLSIDVPVHVQTSTESVRGTSYSHRMAAADIILDVDQIAGRAPSVSSTVVIDRVPGALHDSFLSAPEVADRAWEGVERFVRGYVAPLPEA
ncbi:alpha/beta hydrolase [Brevibacterium litoralis]|uniref:alpha/beta hydrolase n=1 Tax=Brevibacterium litoralis TaxID=3138935 RepID=UPI0032EFAE5A